MRNYALSHARYCLWGPPISFIFFILMNDLVGLESLYISDNIMYKSLRPYLDVRITLIVPDELSRIGSSGNHVLTKVSKSLSLLKTSAMLSVPSPWQHLWAMKGSKVSKGIFPKLLMLSYEPSCGSLVHVFLPMGTFNFLWFNGYSMNDALV